MTNTHSAEASTPIIYGLALNTPAAVADRLAAALTRYRRRTGSRWRTHDVRLQTVLTCAYLEGGHTYRTLARGNHIARSTCYDYIQEGITVLAWRSTTLTGVVRLAVRAGWDYLIVDGVNIPTQRVAATAAGRQHWYSGKHRRHGGTVQTVAAPDGQLLWVSGVLPGKTADARAARRFGIAQKIVEFLGLLADLGYIGLHPQVIVGYKRKKSEKTLPAGKKAANQVLAGIRAIGERANAQLKHWRVLANDFRGNPRRLTGIVKAVLTLRHWTHDPFTVTTP